MSSTATTLVVQASAALALFTSQTIAFAPSHHRTSSSTFVRRQQQQSTRRSSVRGKFCAEAMGPKATWIRHRTCTHQLFACLQCFRPSKARPNIDLQFRIQARIGQRDGCILPTTRKHRLERRHISLRQATSEAQAHRLHRPCFDEAPNRQRKMAWR